MPTPLRTSLNRTWLLKIALFFVVLAGFGTWGLVDALVLYPRRGEGDASHKLRDYLASAERAGRMSASHVSIDDPQARHRELAARAAELARAARDTSTVAGRQADFELKQFHYLEALSRMWRLEPHRTRFPDPAAKKAELDKWAATAPAAKPLSRYDLPVQWLFVLIGYAGALVLLLTFLRAARRVYHFEPGAGRLTLPGGQSITPADLADVDKRRWHKYFVTLALSDGRTVTLDLLRYKPLEDWVLDMERAAFPERAKRSDAAGLSPTPGQPDAADPNEPRAPVSGPPAPQPRQ